MKLYNYLFPYSDRPSRALLLVFILPFLGLSQGFAAKNQSIQMVPRSPVSIRVETPFSEGPAQGHAQLIVTIDNRMEAGQGSWRLNVEASDNHYRSRTVFTTHADMSVPAGQQQTFKLSVPLPEHNQAKHRFAYLSGTFSGDYTEFSNFNLNLINHPSSMNGVILLSPELYRSHGSALASIYDSRKNGYMVSQYYRGMLPEDWRCYVGFDRMIVSRGDWLSINSRAKKAILDAVAAGELELRFQLPGFSPQMASELGIPADQPVWKHGLGVIARYDETMDQGIRHLENGNANARGLLSVRASALKLDNRLNHSRSDVIKNRSQIESFDNLLEDKTPPAGLLSMLMVLFGVFIGPINFFVFAKGRRSLRLFITTPIIAGVASVLLLLGILLLDGVGGAGYISRLIYMGEDDRQIYVEQELVADTGLYFASPFEVAGQEWLTPRGSSITRMSQMESRGTYSKQGAVHSGDWFASKRLQAINLKTYLPLREGFDYLPPENAGSKPAVFSNFRGVCELFYYVDAEGKVWKAENLKLGSKQPLQPIDEKELTTWFAEQQLSAGFNMGQAMNDIGLRPEHFYAAVSDWQQENLQTVSNMRWHLHQQILIGRFKETVSRGGVQ